MRAAWRLYWNLYSKKGLCCNMCNTKVVQVRYHTFGLVSLSCK